MTDKVSCGILSDIINLTIGEEMSEKMATLHVKTDSVGSECTVEMCTEEEWNEMSSQEQDETCKLYMSNVCDVWTTVE